MSKDETKPWPGSMGKVVTNMGTFFDPEFLDQLLAGVDKSDNQSIIQSFEQFLGEVSLLIEQLAAAIADDDKESMSHALLNLKQRCGEIGAYELSAECERLELAYVDNYEVGVREILARIEYGYLKLLNLFNTLTLAQTSDRLLPSHHAGSDSSQPGANILIIDDDLFYREFLNSVLLEEGYRTVVASSGLEGLEMAMDSVPDLVLLDAVMDDMDGFEVCQHIKADQRLSKIPVIMVTGLEDSASIRRSFDVGATNFITKPVNALILNNQLRFILRSKQIEQQLRNSESKLKVAHKLARLGHWRLTPQSGLFECSKQLADMCETQTDQLCESFAHYLRLVHKDDRATLLDAVGEALSGQKGDAIRYRLILKNGTEMVVEQFIEILHGGLNVESILGAVQDVTRQSSLENKIWQEAYYDDVTGVATHRHLMEHMAKAIKLARRQNKRLALFFIEIDGFKLINHELWEANASGLMKKIVTRLKQTIRESDFIARVEGDQLCILASDIMYEEGAAKIAQNCLSAINQPLSMEDTNIAPMARIGIALYPDDAGSKHQLIKAAITASKTARSDSKQMFAFFNTERMNQVTQSLAYQQDVHEALQQQQFKLYYQPIVSTRDGNKMVAVEVILLWYHPGRGLVQDDDCIPLLDRMGKLQVLFEWMLDNVFNDLQQWVKQGSEIQVALKLHLSQFGDNNLIESLKQRLDQSAIRPELIALQIASDAIINNPSIESYLNSLKSLGVSLILEDYGSGHTSLSAIKRLPLDYLKIDQQFVSEILNESENAALLWAIIGMGNAMGYSLIAEGVENLHQLKTLEVYGCDLFQGGFFSAPLNAIDVPGLVVKDHLSENHSDSNPN